MTTSTSATTSTVQASDGVSIAYRHRPAPAGRPTYALVHSLGMDQSFWDDVAARLEGRAGLLTIDARGHGASGLAAEPATAERMAQDLREVVDTLKLDRVIVGGASMGGCVALQFAGSHADRTAGLALIDTTAWYGETAPADWSGRAQKAQTDGLASMTGFQVTRWFSDGYRQREPQRVQHWVDVFLRNDLRGYQDACHMLGSFDGRALLSTIQAPTTILVGEEDYAAPVAMSQAMHAAIAGSQIEVIAGARHLTPLEVPDLVADRLLALGDRVLAARA